MPAPGAISAGETLILSTTGSNQLVLARDGVLLGFWLTAAATVTMYDSKTAAGAAAGNQVMPATILANPGWYPFPATFLAGMVVQISAGSIVLIVV